MKGVLKELKDAGKKTSVLSNGSPQKLTSALNNAGLNELLYGIHSTEQIKIYKPSPAVYEFVEEQLALPRSKICFIAQ